MKKNGFTPVIIVVMVVILGMVGYFAYSKGYISPFSKSNVTSNPNLIASPVPTSFERPKQDPKLPVTGLIQGKEIEMNLNNGQLGKIGTITVLPNWQAISSKEEDTVFVGRTIYKVTIKNGDYELQVNSFSSSRGSNCLYGDTAESVLKNSVYFKDLTGVEYLRYKQDKTYVKELPICSNASWGGKGDKFASSETPYGQLYYNVPENADPVILNQMDNMVASFKTNK